MCPDLGSHEGFRRGREAGAPAEDPTGRPAAFGPRPGPPPALRLAWGILSCDRKYPQGPSPPGFHSPIGVGAQPRGVPSLPQVTASSWGATPTSCTGTPQNCFPPAWSQGHLGTLELDTTAQQALYTRRLQPWTFFQEAQDPVPSACAPSPRGQGHTTPTFADLCPGPPGSHPAYPATSSSPTQLWLPSGTVQCISWVLEHSGCLVTASAGQ